MLSKENMQLGNLVWFGMWKHGPSVAEASWVLRKCRSQTIACYDRDAPGYLPCVLGSAQWWA